MKILNKKWYILRIKNCYINLIKNELLELNKNYNKINIFLPIKKKKKYINGKIKIIHKNYFPGYLIINLILNNKIYFKIKNIKGIIGFLNDKINTLPLPLNDNEINNIINKYNNYNTLDLNEKKKNIFHIGEKVKIKNGIFKNINGIIEKIKKTIIYISIIILNKKTIIKFKYNQIQKLNK
ncbi:MAG: hypothetical protein NHF95_00075 [Candidatus Shikimatogenerans sp. JK-2022]|nr:hypothetical protein [Candidatus Shikimatogenerans bostrichidophilus]